MKTIEYNEILAYETDLKKNHVIELIIDRLTGCIRKKRILSREEAIPVLAAFAGNEDDEDFAKECRAMLERLEV